jgi:phosphoribosylformylglycinamidine synthase
LKNDVYLAKVTITLRKSILDPQGKAVHHALESMGMSAVKQVRIGKQMELTIDAASEEDAAKITEQACKKLLANPVIEDFTFVIERC